MISHIITAADISIVTGFSRHKLKGLFRELPGFDAPAARARVARQYSRHDLIVLAVCCELDEKYGLKRCIIGQLVDGLQKALLGPRSITPNACLVISVPRLTVYYLEKHGSLSDGLVLPLGDIFRRVDAHLEHGKSGPLNLGPVSVPTSAKRGKIFRSIQPVSQVVQKKKVNRAKR